MKVCVDCKVEKEGSCFYFNRAKSRLGPYCKPCASLRSKRWQAANKTSANAHARAWKARNKDRVKAMAAATNAVQRAIRDGKMVRGTICQDCLATGIKTEAAHYDYSKPLDVFWMCTRCHRNWDTQFPKSLVTI